MDVSQEPNIDLSISKWLAFSQRCGFGCPGESFGIQTNNQIPFRVAPQFLCVFHMSDSMMLPSRRGRGRPKKVCMCHVHVYGLMHVTCTQVTLRCLHQENMKLQLRLAASEETHNRDMNRLIEENNERRDQISVCVRAARLTCHRFPYHTG